MADPKPPTTEKGLPAFLAGGWGQLMGQPPGWSYFVQRAGTPPELAFPASVRTFQQMESDAQLRGLMLVSTLPVRRFRWELDPNGARATVVDSPGAPQAVGAAGRARSRPGRARRPTPGPGRRSPSRGRPR